MKKKQIFSILISATILILLWNTSLFGAITIKVDGETLVTDVPPQNIDGRVLIPLRAVSDAFGANTQYLSESKTAVVSYDGSEIRVQHLNVSARINGQVVTLDVPAQIINSRMMVPLRFIGEALGAEVEWIGSSKTVVITNSANKSSKEDLLIKAINQARANKGFAPLEVIPQLSVMAKAHVMAMWNNTFFSHISPSDGDLTARASAYGYSDLGEVLAAGYDDPAQVVAAWLADENHKTILLDPDYLYIGVGLIDQTNGLDPFGGTYIDVCLLGKTTVITAPKNGATLTGTTLTISGYSGLSSDTITVFKMKDTKTYVNRMSVTITPQDNAFSVSVTLPGSGNYKIVYGGNQAIDLTLP